jgi:hypothetical protein
MDLSKVFTINPEVDWRIDHGFNNSVDFCIWVLEIDGLRVPPFDQHPEGNRILQNVGVNADSWRQWLSTVVALQDSILLRNEIFPDQSLWIEEQLNVNNSMYLEFKQHPEWSNVQIDLAAMRSSMLNHSVILEQQYQAAFAKVSHLPGKPIDYRDKPFDVFPGSAEIKEILVSLWQHYIQISEQERAETPYRRETRRITGDGGKKELWGLDYLNIYTVRYPVPVEYFVPSVSVIISLANNLVVKSDDFYGLVERAAISFAQTNG